ncbi:MAG: FG-GAP-like repeat-containing protein [Gemmataceae bacterium]|nr:FG-GAP-like repeat-containing protein [Gemmataceae bacterium]
MNRYRPTLESLEDRSLPALFAPPVAIALGANPVAAITADFNLDGNPDLAFANAGDNTVRVHLNNGSGTFRPFATLAVGNRPVALAVGDFNSDLRPDLAVSSAGSNSVNVFIAFADSFQPFPPVFVGSNPTALAAGDFNRDGRADLAVSNAGNNVVSYLVSLGQGFFQPTAPLAAAGTALATADFNRDGIPDLAAGNRSSVAFFSGVPGSIPRLGSTALLTMPPGALTAADFNGDGFPDLAALTSRNTVNILLGNSLGSFQRAQEFAAVAGPALVVADGDADGFPDLAVGNTILLNNGDGTFQAPQVLGANLVVLAAADGNRDGRVDLIATVGNSVVLLANVPPTASNAGNPNGGTNLIAATGNSVALLANVPSTPSPEDLLFVTQLFADLLHRAPDAAGLASLGSQLASGASRAQIALAMVASPEYREGLVQTNFERFLRRPADPMGLASLRALPEEQLQATLLGSDEYFARAGGDNLAFLRSLYQDVLGRDLDAFGQQAWLQALSQNVSRSQVALMVLSSPEARSRSINLLYDRFLQRPADPAGLASFQSLSIESVIAAIVTSEEYRRRFAG